MSCAYEWHGDSQAGAPYPEIAESLLEETESSQLGFGSAAKGRPAAEGTGFRGSPAWQAGAWSPSLTASGSAAEQG